ncbi:uncharacterized protein LOC123538143 [Mercenaria mercenaria]|uniref:uncharacterized protein LOC123538143 n=1 Tax=Mercenaria mercenaria TaxID=6596 RepID=UPI00234FA2AD|nr:uncharacterized protein LOC123538143 [Mercenaria mercenaria]
MTGYGLLKQKYIFTVLAGLFVFLVLLQLNILDIRVTGNFIRKKQDSVIQQFEHRVWNEHLTNLSVYKGGRLLTEDNLESIKAISIEHCRSQRFLVFKCDSSSLCGGLADRQKGIVSSFLLALLTNRTFVVDMTTPCELNNFLLSNIYNWSMCTDFLKTVPKTNFIELKYVNGNTKKFLNQVESFNFDRNWTKQVVVLRLNAYAIDGIRQHKQARTRLKWLMNITNEEAIHLVLHTLFKPNQRLLKDAVQFYDNKILGRHLVCSHIRIGKNPSIPEDGTRPRGYSNETVIFDFLEKYDDVRKYVIYIASDSEDIKRHAETRFKSYIKIHRTIVHVDRLGKLKRFTKEACEGLYTALLEQSILTLCDTLLLTRSGFGTMAAYLRGTSDNLFLFHPKTQRILESNLTNIQTIFKFL